LYNALCSESQCDFIELNLTATGKIFTLYNATGDSRDLLINITSNNTRTRLTFLSGGQIIFSGRNGSDIAGSGTRGGHAGLLNISVPDLLNTTFVQLIGRGAYTTAASGAGGAGGRIQISFHGLIGNFTDDVRLGTAANIPIMGAGNGSAGTLGSSGSYIYVTKLRNSLRDVDINGDGQVDGTDRDAIKTRYGNETGDATFLSNADINNDGAINILDLFRVGFEWNTR